MSQFGRGHDQVTNFSATEQKKQNKEAPQFGQPYLLWWHWHQMGPEKTTMRSWNYDCYPL